MDVTRAAFEIDSETVTFGGALLIAILSGDLAEDLSRLRRALASVAAQPIAPPLEAALSAWRSEHELFSADATVAWLAERSLAPQQLMAFLRRRAALRAETGGPASPDRDPEAQAGGAQRAQRAETGGPASPDRDPEAQAGGAQRAQRAETGGPASPDRDPEAQAGGAQRAQRAETGGPASPDRDPEVLSLLAEELVFDFRLGAVVHAVAAESVAPAEDLRAIASARRELLRDAEASGGFAVLAAALQVNAVDAEACLDRAARFRVFREAVAASPELELELASSRWSLTRVELVSARFTEESAALEALAQLEADRRLSLAEMGRENGFETEASAQFIADLPDPANAARLGSVLPGETVGPRAQGGAWILDQLRARTAPSSSDPEVAARLCRRLIARRLRRELDRRVSLRPDPLLLDAAS